MSLSELQQDNFAAGFFRMAPHLIPSNGAWRLQNCLLDEDGSAYRRGGTSYKSAANFGADGLRMLWDGYLAGGQRTVFANGADFGVLAADDSAVVNVGGPGLSAPVRPVSIDGLLFAGSSAYGGSRKTSSYTAGTLAVTQDSAAVVGSGTSWAANLDAGMVLTIGSRLYAVKSVEDNTHLTLFRPFAGAGASGLTYSADPVAAVPAAYNPGGSWVAAGNRLISLKGDRIAESNQFDSTTWDPTNEWLMPEGVQLLGGAAVGDTVFVFTTGGVWTLGNLDYDLTDAAGNVQQSLHPLNSDLILLNESGIATWENALLVPAVDGAWLLQSGSARLLSRSITPLYADYVARGYRAGQATVHRSHYLLPVLDANGLPVDLLVGRLDRPVSIRGFGEVFPWTNWQGAGAYVTALAVRVSSGAQRAPVLLGADRSTAGRVLAYSAFRPDGLPVDHDGTAPVWDIIGRDFATGGGQLNKNTVKKLRVRYELTSAAGVADLQAYYGTESRPPASTWGSSTWGGTVWNDPDGLAFSLLAGDAPESSGDDPYPWRVGKRVRYFKPRVRCSDACERAVLRSFEVFVRPSGRL
jgi:hypothetical protein